LERILAVALCLVMVAGAFAIGSLYATAQTEDAIFTGTVTISGTPAPDTLVMYAVGTSGGEPSDNATVTDSSGNYELWVEGGATYTVYFANGKAMFDTNARSVQTIGHGETVTVSPDLTPAPPTEVTIKGLVTNASNPAEPVTVGHVLGITMVSDNPTYINWTTTDGSGYYQTTLLSGVAAVAVFDAKGYYTGMNSTGVPLAPGETQWLNLSLTPKGAEQVHISGYVTVAGSGSPIAGAYVEARMNGAPSTFSNFTDGSGYYTLSTTEGSGELTVSAPGYISQREQNMQFVAGNISRDFQMSLVSSIVRGHVLDGLSMLPIEGANVYASNQIGTNLYVYNYTTTPADGSYELGVGTGNWSVGASANGYASNGTQLSLGSGDDVTLDILLTSENSVIKGFVTDESSGDPISGAYVMVQRQYGPSNSTTTDGTGHYEISVSPGNFRLAFIAMGYAYEMQQDFTTMVGPDEVVWANHSLVPASTQLYGTVSDASTLSPLDGVQVMVSSLSSYPDYWRFNMTMTSGGGSYSLMVPPNPASMVAGNLGGYENTMNVIDIPDAASYEYDFYMIPLSGAAGNYTLSGTVTNISDGSPVPNALVQAVSGFSLFNSTNANSTGYYEMQIPCLVLDIRVSAVGYLPDVQTVLPGAPGGAVTHDVGLTPHAQAPLVDVAIDPSTNASMLNPVDVYSTITEPYLWQVGLQLYEVVGANSQYVWIHNIDQIGTQIWNGLPMGELTTTEVSPGVWTAGLWNWDTVLSDQIMLADGNGNKYPTSFWGTGNMSEYLVWGEYVNSSMMGSAPSWAVFDFAGALLGIDFGSGPDAYAAMDPTGLFWISSNVDKFNLATMQNEMSTLNITVQLETVSMYLDFTADLPSGDYMALFTGVDLANNRASNYSFFMVDNDPPIADAGADQNAVVNTTVTLDASGSFDNVGIASYTWVYVDGWGNPVALDGMVVDTVFNTTGGYLVTLEVSDGAGYMATDSVRVNITADMLPVADAGPDQTVDEDVQVTFDGSGSYDDVGIVNYTWTIPNLSVEMYDVSPVFTFDTPGTYAVELIVTDTLGQTSAPDWMNVTVTDVTPPTADAGSDLNVALGSSFAFDGSLSTDNYAIVNYTWTFTDGSSVTLYGLTKQYMFTTLGAHTVTLTVRDAAGLTDSDTAVITVTDMTDPVAHAGPDQTVAIGTTVHFDGSASTDNVGVTSYTWTFTDVNLRTLTGAAPTYQFNHAGQYIVTLTVADAAGNTDIDTVVVTVEDQTDPVANAGPDQSVNEGATVTFDGSSSTDNVGVDNLTWNFTDASVQITLYGQNPTYVFLSSGTFVVTLTVMDAAGNSDTDTVTIRVNDHPTASAGSDQTVNAGDSVVFNGSASTDDGGAVNLNYTWRINVSGTEVVKYGAIFEYTFDKAGTYTATLTVRDAGGLTSTDQVTMTVQEKAKSFVDSYWWLLVVLAVVVVALALIMLMQRGKGGKAAKKTSSDESASEDEDAGPPEKDEL